MNTSTSFASSTIWTANKQKYWQIELITNYLFSHRSCTEFNNNLLEKITYYPQKQIYNRSVLYDFVDMTEAEFDKNLPKIDLVDKKGKEIEIYGERVKLYKNMQFYSQQTAKDYLDQFAKETTFYLIKSRVIQKY